MYEKRIWTTKKHQKRRSSVFVKNLAQPKEIGTKKKSRNPDSNKSLAHPEETVDNETLQATTRSGHNGRGHRDRVVSQAEHILKMCEIGHEIHISRNLSFRFGGIILILLIIKPS